MGDYGKGLQTPKCAITVSNGLARGCLRSETKRNPGYKALQVDLGTPIWPLFKNQSHLPENNTLLFISTSEEVR